MVVATSGTGGTSPFANRAASVAMIPAVRNSSVTAGWLGPVAVAAASPPAAGGRHLARRGRQRQRTASAAGHRTRQRDVGRTHQARQKSEHQARQKSARQPQSSQQSSCRTGRSSCRTPHSDPQPRPSEQHQVHAGRRGHRCLMTNAANLPRSTSAAFLKQAHTETFNKTPGA